MESEVPEWLKLDPSSPHPPYEQLRQLIVEAANSGRIAVGVRLPPVRTLAAHLGVAANTVARAYRELERAQIVITRSRAGTVIAAAGDEARRRTAEGAADYARIVKSSGLKEEEAVAYLRAALRRA